MALETGRRTLPKYGHRFSRQDFTLPQLFACLVLRKFFQTDYRGICEILNDCPALCEQVGLKKVPHFTTLQKKERTLLRDAAIKRMLSETVALYHDLDSSSTTEKKARMRLIWRLRTPPVSRSNAPAATT